MTDFEQGDIVRVPFPYTDRATRQFRPALVVSKGGVGEANALLWVAMITSAEHRAWPGDVAIDQDDRQTGLSAASVVRSCKIATIDARYAAAVGCLSPKALGNVLAAIRIFIG